MTKIKYSLASSTWYEKELNAINEVIKSDFFTIGDATTCVVSTALNNANKAIISLEVA